MSLFQRQSPFIRALKQYGFERCSVSQGQVWIGLPADPAHGRTALSRWPDQAGSVLFVEAPEQAALIGQFVRGPEAQGAEHLMIGTSHDYIGPARPLPYDMSGAVAALQGARLSALKRLSLGSMEQLFNGHAYFGTLGGIDHVFDVAPNMEKLDLSGCFALSRPISHQCLETLVVAVDEIGVTGGPLSQASVSNLLASRLPRLRELDLALNAENAPAYAIPDSFFEGNAFPMLQSCAMDCLEPASEARLLAFKTDRKLAW